QVRDLPLRARRHRRFDAGRTRGLAQRVTFAAERGAVLAVIHHGEGTGTRSRSSGPLLSALFTSVDTAHFSSSSAGIGASSFVSVLVSRLSARSQVFHDASASATGMR